MPSVSASASDGESVPFGLAVAVWADPSNVREPAEFENYATAQMFAFGTLSDHLIYVSIDGFNPDGSNLAGGGTWQSGDPEEWTYGSPTELWGRSWSLNDVNNFSFSILISVIGSGSPSEYLRAFGFLLDPIPPGSTIDGVEFDLVRENQPSGYAAVTDVRCTVYYTEPSTTTTTSTTTTSTTSTSTTSTSTTTSTTSTTTSTTSSTTTTTTTTPAPSFGGFRMALTGFGT